MAMQLWHLTSVIKDYFATYASLTQVPDFTKQQHSDKEVRLDTAQTSGLLPLALSTI